MRQSAHSANQCIMLQHQHGKNGHVTIEPDLPELNCNSNILNLGSQLMIPSPNPIGLYLLKGERDGSIVMRLGKVLKVEA